MSETDSASSSLTDALASGPGAASGTPGPGRDDLLVRLSRGLIYLGMALLPMIEVRVSHSLDVSDAVFAMAAVALALSARPPRRAPKATAWYLGGLLFVVGGIVSSFDAISPMGSLQVVGNGVFVLFVWQWAVRYALDTTPRIEKALSAYILGSTLSAAAAIVQSVAHTTLGLGGAGESSSRAIGLAQQTNIAAITLALAIVFSLGIVMERGRDRLFWYRLACIVVLALGLMFTGSVSGIVSTLVGLAVLLLRRGVRLRRIVAVAVVVAGIYVAGTYVENATGHSRLNPFSRIQATTGQNTGYNTVDPRLEMYKTAWSLIVQSPLVGHGLDAQSAVVYYDPYLGVSYPTHDFFLLLWYEGGILLVFGAALTMGSGVGRLWRGSRSIAKDALLGGAVTVLVYSLAGPELVDRWLWLPFVLAMAVRHGRGVEAGAQDAGPAAVT